MEGEIIEIGSIHQVDAPKKKPYIGVSPRHDRARQGMYRDRTRRALEDNQELREKNAELYNEVIHDKLTGLFSRRYFEETLEERLTRATRDQHEPKAFVFMSDLDDFGSVNKQYNEMVGDEVLRQTSAVFKEELRTEDAPSRWGGEEFTGVMYYNEEEGTIPLNPYLMPLERVQARLHALRVEGVDRNYSASIGVTRLRTWVNEETGRTETETREELMERVADTSKLAKLLGKDRIVCSYLDPQTGKLMLDDMTNGDQYIYVKNTDQDNKDEYIINNTTGETMSVLIDENKKPYLKSRVNSDA